MLQKGKAVHSLMSENHTEDEPVASMCDRARDAVCLPPVDRDWLMRWGRRLDCAPCPANDMCQAYHLMKSMEPKPA